MTIYVKLVFHFINKTIFSCKINAGARLI